MMVLLSLILTSNNDDDDDDDVDGRVTTLMTMIMGDPGCAPLFIAKRPF